MSAVAPERETNRGVAVRDDGARKPPARFPKSARLLRHADFERVYKQGRRHFSSLMTVFYLQRQRTEAAEAAQAAPAAKITPGFRVGFTVGRALGGAVQRNRMKRRLREAVRLSHPSQEIAADVVINPKKTLLTADFTAIANEVSRAFVVIEEKLGKEGKSSGARGNAGQLKAEG